MKNLKTCFTLLVVLFSMVSFSQDRGHEKRERVKAMKVAYITNELQLTSDESAKFWPIYNAYEDKQRELRRIRVAGFLERKNDAEIDKMTDKEAASALAQMEKSEEDLYELRKKFQQNLKSVLPAKKIIKLKRAEEDFNRDLLRQYRERRKK